MSTQTEAHLSEAALLRWQAGDASDTERAHMESCALCQANARPLADAVTWFSAAAREWGEEKARAAREWSEAKTAAAAEWKGAVTAAGDEWRSSKTAATRQWRGMAAGWAVVCAVLLITLLVGLPRWQAHKNALQEQARQQQMQQELARDNALLEEVDRDVSQVVPDAMQPLSRVGGDSSTGSGTKATARQ